MALATLSTKDFVSIDSADTLSKLVGALVERNHTEACVFDKGVFQGMFAYRYLLHRARLDPQTIHVRALSEPVPVLFASDSVLTAAERLFSSQHAMLPLSDPAHHGVITIAAVLEELKQTASARSLHVSDIEQTPTPTLYDTDPIGRAFAMFNTFDTDRLPVVDEHDKITGFLSGIDLLRRYYLHSTERDYGGRSRLATRAFRAEMPNLLHLPVRDFMQPYTRDTSIALTATVAEAIDALHDKGVLSLVLLKDDVPVALVTARNILKAFLDVQSSKTHPIQYKGLHELQLDRFSKQWVERLSSYYGEKFSHFIQNDYTVIVHLKEASKHGKRHRYTASVRVHAPGIQANAEAEEWDIRVALHQAFQELESELEHYFPTATIASVRKLAALDNDDNLPGALP
jgi:CBS domain-containing protein/ribosome-associated translation inhibitor RaiA